MRNPGSARRSWPGPLCPLANRRRGGLGPELDGRGARCGIRLTRCTFPLGKNNTSTRKELLVHVWRPRCARTLSTIVRKISESNSAPDLRERGGTNGMTRGLSGGYHFSINLPKYVSVLVLITGLIFVLAMSGCASIGPDFGSARSHRLRRRNGGLMERPVGAEYCAFTVWRHAKFHGRLFRRCLLHASGSDAGWRHHQFRNSEQRRLPCRIRLALSLLLGLMPTVRRSRTRR